LIQKRAAGVGAPARKDTPVLRVVTDESTRGEPASALDEICREGARRMLAAALEAEADVYIAELVGETDERGHRLAARNGHARPRRSPRGPGRSGSRRPG
jgi:putative transposase